MYCDVALCNPLLSYKLLFDNDIALCPVYGVESGRRVELVEVKELG